MSNPESAETEKNVRERILDAAVAILSEDGINALSQVQVARRAEVRQSHLTYYFPKRHDLINAVAERMVESMASQAREVVSDARKFDAGQCDAGAGLKRLADAIATEEHMRMFVGAIVEADRDPGVRAILMRETVRLEKVLAELLASDDAAEEAQLLLASLWGLGLYAFLSKEPPRNDPSVLFKLVNPAVRG